MRIAVKSETMSVEEVCWTYLAEETGDRDRAAALARGGYVEQVLALNPGLAALAADNADTVPFGTAIEMPAVPTTDTVATVKLWD